MILKRKRILKHIFYFIILFILSTQDNINIENEEKYFFTMYTSQNNNNASNIYANNPFSEFLSINVSDENEVKIQKELTTEFTYKDISSVLLYEKQYLIKTCYGPNIIMEVLLQDDIESKKETIKFNYKYISEHKFNISNNLVFCYTSVINNPDKNFPDKKAIITIFSEKNTNNNVEKKYSHKYILFFPESVKFRNSYSFHSDNPNYFSNKIPKYLQLFEKQIFIARLMMKNTNLF